MVIVKLPMVAVTEKLFWITAGPFLLCVTRTPTFKGKKCEEIYGENISPHCRCYAGTCSDSRQLSSLRLFQVGRSVKPYFFFVHSEPQYYYISSTMLGSKLYIQ